MPQKHSNKLFANSSTSCYESSEFMKRLIYYPRFQGFFQHGNAEIWLSPTKMISSHTSIPHSPHHIFHSNILHCCLTLAFTMQGIWMACTRIVACTHILTCTHILACAGIMAWACIMACAHIMAFLLLSLAVRLRWINVIYFFFLAFLFTSMQLTILLYIECMPIISSSLPTSTRHQPCCKGL